MKNSRVIAITPARVEHRPPPEQLGGLVFLPLAALLLFVTAVVRGAFDSPAYVPDAARYGRLLASERFFAGEVLHLIAFACLLLGTAALGTLLGRRTDGHLARIGRWPAVAGVALQMAAIAAIAFTWPAFGREMAAGNFAALERLRASYQGPLFLAAAGLGTGLYVVGVMLMSIPLWRGSDLPRYCAPLYVLHAPPITVAASFLMTFEQIGAFFLLVSAGYLAWSLHKREAHPPRNAFEARELGARA